MKEEIIAEAKKKMDRANEALQDEFGRLRTGRASVSILDGLMVDYYGSLTPVNQVATVSVPESRLIVIQPWDTTQIEAIEKAIFASDLGLTPSNDGKVIRISIPVPTEERRKELVKVARRYAEECRVSIRNSRREANEHLKELEKEKEIAQDEHKRAHDEVQRLTDKEVKGVDGLLVKKEKEIMEV